MEMFIIKERKYGQKITKIRASAVLNGEKTELFCAQSVGYKLIKSFDATEADEIIVEVLESLDTPVLDKIGAYLIEEEKENEDIFGEDEAEDSDDDLW